MGYVDVDDVGCGEYLVWIRYLESRAAVRHDLEGEFDEVLAATAIRDVHECVVGIGTPRIARDRCAGRRQARRRDRRKPHLVVQGIAVWIRKRQSALADVELERVLGDQ